MLKNLKILHAGLLSFRSMHVPTCCSSFSATQPRPVPSTSTTAPGDASRLATCNKMLCEKRLSTALRCTGDLALTASGGATAGSNNDWTVLPLQAQNACGASNLGGNFNMHPATASAPRLQPSCRSAHPSTGSCRHVTCLTAMHRRALSTLPTARSYATGDSPDHHRAPNRPCWHCQQPVPAADLVCPACSKIQPLDSSLNHYELMDLGQPRFDVALGDLEKRYKILQFKLHPDKSATASPAEQQHAADQASAVNAAYSVLKSPLLRANYLLQLGEHRAPGNREDTIDDPELLMQVILEFYCCWLG